MAQQNYEKRIAALEDELKKLKSSYSVHQHADSDGTQKLRKTQFLDQDQVYTVGSTQVWSKQSFSVADGLVYEGIMETGSQMQQTTTVQSPNMRIVSKQFESVSADVSEFYGNANPLVFAYENSLISTTAAGTTVTINGYNFAVNSLGGSIINIYNSSGDLVESQVISSNTATVITIVDSWVNSTSDGSFKIYNRVALGSTENVWYRVHVWTGSSGGIWFGGGTLTQGTVSSLFVNPTTYDLMYSYPFGHSGGIVNLTGALAQGVSGNFFASSTNGGATDVEVTVTDGIITDIN